MNKKIYVSIFYVDEKKQMEVAGSKRKDRLLILDMDGFLCLKIRNEKIKEIPEKIRRIRLNKNCVFVKIPTCRQFLKWCFANYTVAFFTSMMLENAEKILTDILTPNQRKRILFVWGREHVKLDPDFGVDEKITRYDSIKLLSDVWQSAMVNTNRKFNETNTIFCDDSERKHRFNPEKNILIVESFTHDHLLDSSNIPSLMVLCDSISESFNNLTLISNSFES